MGNSKVQTAFSELGLTGGEGRLLQFLLSEGPCTGSQAAARLGMHKPSAYFLLERLSKKGLASFVVVNGNRQYRAIEPGVLKLKLDERSKQFSSNIVAMQAIAKNVKREEKHAFFRIFEGWNGMKDAFDDVLEHAENEEYLVFAVAVPEKIFPRFRRFIAKFHKERAKKGIVCKVLVSEKFRGTIGADRKKEVNTVVRFVSIGQAMPMISNVYGDRVMMAVWTDPPLAMIVEGSDVSVSFREVFRMIWEGAKK